LPTSQGTVSRAPAETSQDSSNALSRLAKALAHPDRDTRTSPSQLLLQDQARPPVRPGFTIYPGKIPGLDTFRLANLGAIGRTDIEAFLEELRTYLHHSGIL
jgi:hypothetical protein